MKRFLLSATMVFALSALFAQNGTIKGKTFGVSYTLHDYKTVSDLDVLGTSAVLTAKDWKKINRMKPGIAINYTKGLNEHFDVNARFGFSYVDYKLSTQPYMNNTISRPLFELDANLFMKLVTDDYWVSPFLSLGAGASSWRGYGAAYIPAGVGLQLNLFDKTYVVLQSQYRSQVTANASGHIFHGLSLMATLD